MPSTLLILTCTTVLAAANPEFRTVQIPSSRDGSMQPMRVYVPAADQPVPLLVVLHTWGGGYDQKGFADACLPEADARKWAVVVPHFRGPNVRPEACGSELVVQDVLDAVAYMRKQTKIDDKRIYLVGTSGGGHLALLMAGRKPELWAGVSAWVPISDLAGWHHECRARQGFGRYADNLEKVCAGPPGKSPEVDREYRQRSPLTHLAAARGLPIDINAGIDDGHTGSVPIRHSLNAFNLLAETNGQPEKKLKREQIETMTTMRQVPAELAKEKVEEMRKHPILFRREAGPARVTIFQGGHEGDMPPAIRWLERQARK